MESFYDPNGSSGDPLIDNLSIQEKWRLILEEMLTIYPNIEKIDYQQEMETTSFSSFGYNGSLAGRRKLTLTITLS